MRISIVYRYFHPDTPPYATMLKDMVGWLAEAGHDVRMITAQPSYKPEAGIPRQPWRETLEGVAIRRLPLLPERGRGPLRRINSLLFVVLASLTVIFSPRRDLIWTASMPPVFQGALLRLAAALKGSRFLYHVQDIYPEIALVSGLMREGRVARWLKAVDARTIAAADAVVVPGEDMAASLEARGGPAAPVSVISNFAIGADHMVENDADSVRQGAVRFIFAGNLGRFQNLEKLVEAFGRVDPAHARLDLLGDGEMRAALEDSVRRLGIGNVAFHGFKQPEEAFRQIRASDVAVISLDKGIARYAFPSKTLTYLAAGRPLLAFVAADCSLARMIADAGAGVVLDARATPAEVARQIEAAAGADLKRMKEGARALSRIFSLDRTREKWLSLMDSLQENRVP
ncbi:MAG: glycosyltransferase family 4 protein [Flavobacteriaceae bacterium]